MNNNQTIQILTLLLVFFVIVLFALIGVLVIKKLTKNKKQVSTEEISKAEKPAEVKSKEVVYKSYTKDSIYNFMEFDKVEDNMIIQKNGIRFLMVVECEGVNYDLMSELEKVGVEEGFLQFLNSLRYPVQIYVQSRTINLTSSIENYRKKISEYKSKLDKMTFEYEKLKENPLAKKEVLQKYNYEITKQRNLYEYGQDIIENTQKMNLNKNVLSKKYYIIIPYYSEETVGPEIDKEDIKNMAFSELYTRAQAVIRTLSACEVSSKILNSSELINLLYVAYNRDESETFSIDKLIQAGCEEIYTTAPDVFESKIKALDEVIAREAQAKAEEAYQTVVKSNKQKIAESKEQNIEDLIAEMAKEILEENKRYIGEESAEEAKEIIEKTKESKGGSGANEKRRTTRKARVS